MRGLCTTLLTSVDEMAVGVGEKPLTFRRNLHKLSCFSWIAPSSNGKTADSGQSSAFRVLRAFLPPLPSVDKIVCWTANINPTPQMMWDLLNHRIQFSIRA